MQNVWIAQRLATRAAFERHSEAYKQANKHIWLE